MGEYYIDVNQVSWKWNIDELWMNPQRELDAEHVKTIEESMKRAPDHRWRQENIIDPKEILINKPIPSPNLNSKLKKTPNLIPTEKTIFEPRIFNNLINNLSIFIDLLI